MYLHSLSLILFHKPDLKRKKMRHKRILMTSSSALLINRQYQPQSLVVEAGIVLGLQDGRWDPGFAQDLRDLLRVVVGKPEGPDQTLVHQGLHSLPGVRQLDLVRIFEGAILVLRPHVVTLFLCINQSREQRVHVVSYCQFV